MDRYHELENFRRSLAMAPPESSALTREEAMKLVAETQELLGRLERVKESLLAAMKAMEE